MSSSPCQGNHRRICIVSCIPVGPTQRTGTSASVCIAADTVYDRQKVVWCTLTALCQIQIIRSDIDTLAVNRGSNTDARSYWISLSESGYTAIYGHKAANLGKACICQFRSIPGYRKFFKCRTVFAVGHGNRWQGWHGIRCCNTGIILGSDNLAVYVDRHCYRDFFFSVFDRTSHLEDGFALFQGIFVIIIPGYWKIFRCSICKSSLYTLRKRDTGRTAENIAVFWHAVAAYRIGRSICSSFCLDADTLGSHAARCNIQFDITGIFGGFYDHQCFSGVSIDPGRCAVWKNACLLEFIRGCLVSVVHAGNAAVAFQSKVDGIGCFGVQVSVCISHINGDISKAAAIGDKFCFVSTDFQFCCSIRSRNRSIAFKLCDFFAVFIEGFCRNRTFFKCNIEYGVGGIGTVSIGSCTNAAVVAYRRVSVVSMTGSRSVCLPSSGTDQSTVAVKFYLRCIAVYPYRCFAAWGKHIVAVPCSDKVKRVFFFIPLAAVEIIGIFRKTAGFYNTKIAAVWNSTAVADRTASGAVPWSRFTDVIKTGPYKFTGNTVGLIGIVNGFMCCDSPSNSRSIIAGQMEFTVGIGTGCLCTVNTAAVDMGRCFTGEDHTAVLWSKALQLAAGVCIVEADYTAVFQDRI